MSDRLALPPERRGYAASRDLLDSRAQMAAAAAAGMWKTARPPVEDRLGGIRVLRYRPCQEPCGHIMHLHGGGFRRGMPEYAGPFAEALADRCGVEVIAPHYRLAPEFPFPAGVSDGWSALSALREAVRDRPLFLSGDSAGGGMAAALVALSAAAGAAPPDGLILLSPWLDLRVVASSYDDNENDPLFSRAAANEAADHYLQGFDPAHPLASPLLAPLGPWPATIISVGSGEVLLDDARHLHARLVQAGRTSELLVIDGMEHSAAVRGPDLPGSRQTLDAVTDFVRRRTMELGGNSGIAT